MRKYFKPQTTKTFEDDLHCVKLKIQNSPHSGPWSTPMKNKYGKKAATKTITTQEI
jgi:hypothetical protein